jgi:hypothetical protein
MAHAFLFLGLLALTMAPVAMAQSQQGTGQIVGTVYDQTGASVPKAKVTATGKGTGLLRETEAMTGNSASCCCRPGHTRSR